MPNRAILTAWCSLVVDPRTSKIYSVANGGHTDYDGNQSFCFDVEREAPVWSQLRASTTVGDTCVAYNAALDPTSRHSYYGLLFNEFDNRIMMCGGVWACSSGTPNLPTMDSYNLVTDSYSPAGTHPDVPAGLRAPDMVWTLDPTTCDIYGMNVNTFGKWTRSSNTWSVSLGDTGSPPTVNGAPMSAFDTMRGRVFILGGANSAHSFYTKQTNVWTQPTITGARATDLTTAARASMQYVEAIDAYVVRRSPAGNDVIKIDAQSFEAVTLPNLTGGAALQNNDPYTLPNNDGAGPYNKFLHVQRLRGAVFVNGYNSNCYFLRLY